jgi:hypothetical protein
MKNPLNTRTINEKICEFVKDYKKSDGGYAPVDQNELAELYEIIDMIIKMKYQPDPDGDLPLRCTIQDRTRFMKIPFTEYIEYESSLERASALLRLSNWASNLAHGDIEEINREKRNEKK